MCFRVKESVVTATVCGLSKRCAATQTRVWCCCDRVWQEQRPVVSDVAHTHVCFRSTKSGVTVPVCEVCQWCLLTHTCARRMHVLLLYIRVGHPSSLSHTHTCACACAWPMQRTRGQFAHTHTHTHMCVCVCVLQKQSAVTLPVAWLHIQ